MNIIQFKQYIYKIPFFKQNKINIFNIILHSMLELTFSVGENRTRMTDRRLSHPSFFNDLMKLLKVPREFPRRIRELDFAVFKAQEMRNISIFFFPIVIQCIETGAKERRLWFLLAFMLRSCLIPNNEYENIDDHEIHNACEQFYTLFEKLFSSKNCTYSIHVFSSHLLQLRLQGPLTETSAFFLKTFMGRCGDVSRLELSPPQSRYFKKYI